MVISCILYLTCDRINQKEEKVIASLTFSSQYIDKNTRYGEEYRQELMH